MGSGVTSGGGITYNTIFPEFQSFTPAGYALNNQSVSQQYTPRSTTKVIELLPFEQVLQDPFFATSFNTPSFIGDPTQPTHTKLKPIFNRGSLNNSNNNSSRNLKCLQQEKPSTMLSSRKDSEEMSPKAKVSYDESKFQVEFDVKDYKPEELSIKTEGTTLVVLAKHEDKSGDSSYVTKQFEQRFTLPSGVSQTALVHLY